MQTQQKAVFAFKASENSTKNSSRCGCILGRISGLRPPVLSLNTTNNISSRTGCQAQPVRNDIFAGPAGQYPQLTAKRYIMPSSVWGPMPIGPRATMAPALRWDVSILGAPAEAQRRGGLAAGGDEGSGACGDAVTLRLRDGQLLTARRKCRWPAASLFFGLRSSCCLLPGLALLITSASRN